MWRREKTVQGPERPGFDDIDPLNRIFSAAFTDRYRRDGMPGVRVPHLNHDVWRFALESAGEGAMIWRDRAGEIVRRRYGKHLTPEKLEAVTREMDGRVQGGKRLRESKLANGDEPDFTFRP